MNVLTHRTVSACITNEDWDKMDNIARATGIPKSTIAKQLIGNFLKSMKNVKSEKGMRDKVAELGIQ